MKKITWIFIVLLLLISIIGCDATSPYPETMWTKDIIPGFDITYNLGSPANRWNTIYVNNIISGGGGALHTQGTDQGLDTGGANATTAAQVKTAVTNTHIQNTDVILTTDGITALFNAGLLSYDLKTDRWLLNDSNVFLGVGVAGLGNLAHTIGITGYENTAIGADAAKNITTGYSNTFIGHNAGTSLTSGYDNTGVGADAGNNISTANSNAAFGDQSLMNNTGSANTAIGKGAMGAAGAGSYNTAVGLQAQGNDTTGSSNTAIGVWAGANNTGSSNVFLGYRAGENNAANDKLYIDNSNTATPLISGDFSTDTVTINNTLSMAGNINMVPGATVDGVDVSAIGGVSHTQNTDNILKQSAGGADLINSATLKSNLAVDAGITVDGVDISGHEARHEQFGADELNIRPLQVLMPSVFYPSDYTLDIVATVTGSGYTGVGRHSYSFATGATSGSTARRVCWDGLWHDYHVADGVWRYSSHIVLYTATDLMDSWIGFFASPTVWPTTISNHYSFRFLSTANGTNCDVWATNGNGVAETATKIRSNVAQWDTTFYGMVYSASDIKYYYSANGYTWTLGATHTTNRPDNQSLVVGGWITNSEAVDKLILLDCEKYMQGGQP